MEDIIKIVEKSGFNVTNKENFSEIEIKDSQNNNESLKRFFKKSNSFYGSDGRSISLFENYVLINLSESLSLVKDESNKNKNIYEITYRADEATSCKINIVFNFASDKNNGSLTVKINAKDYLEDNQILHIEQDGSKTSFIINNDSWSVDFEESDFDLYLETILDFFSKNNFIYNHNEIHKCFQIILSSLGDDIDKLILSNIENIDNYIKKLENLKIEYQNKISSIDFDIQRLNKLKDNKTLFKN